MRRGEGTSSCLPVLGIAAEPLTDLLRVIKQHTLFYRFRLNVGIMPGAYRGKILALHLPQLCIVSFGVALVGGWEPIAHRLRLFH